jgi:endoglucanase
VLASIFAPIVVVAAGFVFLVSAAGSSPFDSARLYVNPDSQAVSAAQNPTGDDDLVHRIAATPTAIWLTPEEYGSGRVGPYVASVVADAASTQAVPVFVVYGIPDRDCGSFSAGGLSASQYPGWVREIAAAVGDSRSVVIVEPDALALANECPDEDERVLTVSRAVEAFSATAAWVYLDGGHSNWRSPEDMAALLDRAGVGKVRGFATNVSNFNTTESERAYAEELSALVGGAHYVIDTSRNGAGANGEWCNPSGRALGDTPLSEATTGAMDANLWIKAPGESDGTCNGGPPAGQWWQEAAVALAREAGW